MSKVVAQPRRKSWAKKAYADSSRKGGEATAATKALRRPLPSAQSDARVYTPDELEFLKACQAYQSRYRLRFMTATEYLLVLRSLGYVKT